MYTFRQIFKQAFSIAWKYPSLWFFGFFVALLGTGTEGELFFGNSGLGGQGIFSAFLQGLFDSNIFTFEGMKGLYQSAWTHPLYLFLLIILSLVAMGLSVLVVWLTIVAQTSLIASAIAKTKNKFFGFKESFGYGISKFWPVFFLNLILRIVFVVLMVVIGIFTAFKFPGSNVLFVLIFNLTLAIIILISFITKFAICGSILKEWKFKESLINGWMMFKKNWLVSIEISFVIFCVVAFIDLFLAFLITQIFGLAFKLFLNFPLGILITFCLVIVGFVISQAIISVFQWSTWAIVFELLSSKKPALFSRIENIFSKNK